MTVLSRNDLLNEVAILGDELYQKTRPRVIDHVRRMRAARDPDTYNAAHRQLLIEYAARREAINSTVPGHRHTIKAELERLRQFRPVPVQDLRVQQERLVILRQQEQVSRALRHILRVITDGLVWRALDLSASRSLCSDGACAQARWRLARGGTPRSRRRATSSTRTEDWWCITTSRRVFATAT